MCERYAPGVSVLAAEGELPSTCTLCGAQETRPAYHKNGFEVVRCAECNLVYVSDAPSADVLRQHYDWRFFQGGTERFGYHDYERESAALNRNFRQRIKLIERHCRGGQLLDVGCALGYFMAQLGSHWAPVGSELSGDVAEYTRRTFGFDVVEGEFDQIDLPNGSYDVVTMWDVIEHARNPMRMLKKAAQLLRPGGVLALTTGDIGSICARVSGQRWYLMVPPTHLFFFTNATLKRAVTQAGLTIVDVRYTGKHVAFSEIFFRLSYILGVSAFERLAERIARTPLGEVSLYYNLRDIMTLVAVKRNAPS